MNLSILKHSFWACGVLLLACKKSAAKSTSDTTPPPAETTQNIPTQTTAKQNLIWIPVGKDKTLQTTKNIFDGKLTEVDKTNGKTKFTAPTTDPSENKLTNEYKLDVNLDDIKPSETENYRGTYLGIRLMVQGAGVSYIVLKSFFPNDINREKTKGISFGVVTETETSQDAKTWKEEKGSPHSSGIGTFPKYIIYDKNKPKHTLVLFNGFGLTDANNHLLFKAGDQTHFFLVAQKGTGDQAEAQVIKLILNFVNGTGSTK